MIQINIKANIYQTLKGLKASLKRFPVTIITSVVLVILLIALEESRSYWQKEELENLTQIIMVIALGLPLFTSMKFFLEKKGKYNGIFQIILFALGGIFLLLYYFFLLKDFKTVSISRYIGMSVFLYVTFLYIPRLGRREDYEYYIIKIFSSFLMTLIYSFVLFAGISLILFSVSKLFSVNIEGKIYYYAFVIIAGLFSVPYFLAKIPLISSKFSDEKYSKGLKILLLYIVIPLILIYTLILYVYFGKIVLTQQWPIGLVSNLVLWYTTLSIGVIFLIYPLKVDNNWAKYFINWFPKIILPILIMMFVSMGIRVRAYGITENRYYVLVLGIWVSAIMLYFIFAKEKRNIIIPVTFSVIVLNSIFGPLSGFSVSEYSQNRRFVHILEKNNMIEDGNIVKSQESISADDRAEISSILDYFEDNHSLEDIKYLPSGFAMGDMDEVLGFSYVKKASDGRGEYLYYSSYENEGAIDVKDYDYFMDSNSLYRKSLEIEGIRAEYDINSFAFSLVRNGKVMYTKDLNEYGRTIYENNKNTEGKSTDPAEMTFTDENDDFKIKYIIRSLSGKLEGDPAKFHLQNMEINILLKIK